MLFPCACVQVKQTAQPRCGSPRAGSAGWWTRRRRHALGSSRTCTLPTRNTITVSSSRHGRCSKAWCGKFYKLLRHFILHKKPNIYQARLGTYIGKAEKETFLQGFGSTPSYYQLMNSLDSLAEFTRAERLAIGNR